jgi:hypothetical protein
MNIFFLLLLNVNNLEYWFCFDFVLQNREPLCLKLLNIFDLFFKKLLVLLISDCLDNVLLLKLLTLLIFQLLFNLFDSWSVDYHSKQLLN